MKIKNEEIIVYTYGEKGNVEIETEEPAPIKL